ncbi:MAG: class I SAM-dependent methyltransferase [Firmicutes bacterium]|nr:class I SAM-dependent methyltransferase [Bacillota bacterium]
MAENFDAMAQGFDTDRRIDRAEIIADEIRGHITSGREKSAIEFGCGTGLVGLQLAEEFSKLLLIDFSAEMVGQVEQKINKLGIPSISALCCDIMADTELNLRADYIFSSLVLHHIIDTEAILRRFYTMLNDGGHLVIVDIDQEDGSFHAKYPEFEGHNGFSHAALKALALKAGFATVNIDTFYHDSKVHNGKESPYSLFILDAALPPAIRG